MNLISHIMNIAILDAFPLSWKGITISAFPKTFIQRKESHLCLLPSVLLFLPIAVLCSFQDIHKHIQNHSDLWRQNNSSRVPLQADLWKSCSHDHRSDQTLFCKINPFRETPPITQNPIRLPSRSSSNPSRKISRASSDI